MTMYGVSESDSMSDHYAFVCSTCGEVQHGDIFQCARCAGPLDVTLPAHWEARSLGQVKPSQSWLSRDFERYPLRTREAIVYLGEGTTPCVQAEWSHEGAKGHVWLKCEHLNPTGSHKDRSLALACSKAVESGYRGVALVSTGSTALSAAAYAAKAGLDCLIIVDANARRERLVAAVAMGATVVRVDEDVDELQAVLRESVPDDFCVVSTSRISNPFQATACKSIAFELASQVGPSIDSVWIPVGGGGTLAAIHRGFVELFEAGAISAVPRMMAVVPQEYDYVARLVEAHQRGQAIPDLPAPQHPSTLVKLAHINPPDGMEAAKAILDSGGAVHRVSDESAVDAQVDLATRFGHYVEPSSGATWSAYRHVFLESPQGADPESNHVVLLCGSGFRESFLDSNAAESPRWGPVISVQGLRDSLRDRQGQAASGQAHSQVSQ